MSREVPFNEKAVCDSCGAKGAFDFMGDFLCGECATPPQHTEEEFAEWQALFDDEGNELPSPAPEPSE